MFDGYERGSSVLRFVARRRRTSCASPRRRCGRCAMSAEGTRRAIVAAFLANLGIAISKFVAFVITGSASMLAEVDPLGRRHRQPGAAVPRRQARAQGAHRGAPVRLRHRALLLGVHRRAGALHPRRDVRDVRGHPEAHRPARARVADRGRSPCSASPSCSRPGRCAPRATRRRRAARGGRGGGSSARPRAPSCRSCCSRTPARSSVCVFALIGISLAEITGNARWDALGSIGIGLLLGVIAIVLAIEMKSLLIGEAVAPAVDAAIRDAILAGPEVTRIIHLRTQHLGPDDVLLAAKLEFTSRTIPDARRRDRHGGGARANLGADRPADLLRTRPLRRRRRTQTARRHR